MRRAIAGILAGVMLMGAVGVPVVMPGGTRVIDQAMGAGALAEPGRTLWVHYTGWVWSQGLKGRQFDSSRDGAPFVFTLGSGDVIFGWDEGVAGMRVGGKRTLRVPASAAYGSTGSGPDIPPGATLLFEIELIDVR
jgi:FKBP-type peptidyl-prolyl cis-trans isomerase